MKQIIRKTITLLSVAAGASFAGSCSLDEQPSSFIGSSDYYRTPQQCVAGLNACYIPLKTIYNYTFLIAVEGVTDLMYIKSGTLDAQLDISPAVPRLGATMWRQGYLGVMYSNAVIAGIRRSPLSEEEQAPLLAEGIVMRAFYYWLLTSFFGDVPFYTQDVADEQIRTEIAHLGRMPADETRAYLIEELEQWVPSLDQIRSSEVADNRCGAAMGWMVMAKLAMWNEDWDAALRALEHLESIYGELTEEAYPLSDILWRVKDAPESIFEIRHTYTEGGLSVVGNCACICTPTRSSANDGYTYDGVVIRELGNSATTWTALRPNPYYYNSLMPRNGSDRRTSLNLAWEYDGQAFANARTVPWPGPKFWCPGMDNQSDSNNPCVFRYADAVLMQAECYCELHRWEESIACLDKVKARAGIDLYGAFRNQDHLTTEIRKERGRELLGEFQRKFDLVRWGIWYTKTLESADYETVRNAILPCHEYYPIPDTEVAASDNALDNDAYAIYGL